MMLLLLCISYLTHKRTETNSVMHVIINNEYLLIININNTTQSNNVCFFYLWLKNIEHTNINNDCIIIDVNKDPYLCIRECLYCGQYCIHKSYIRV